MTARQLLIRFESIDIAGAVSDAMKDNEQDILNLNREQLYDRGEGVDSKPLPPYSAAYAKRKARPGIVDIYKSGELQAEMTLHFEGQQYAISSAAPHTVYVWSRRQKIFGLTEESKSRATVIIAPALVARLKAAVG